MRLRNLFGVTFAMAVLTAACSSSPDLPVSAGAEANTPTSTVAADPDAAPGNNATPLADATTRSDRVMASTARWPTDWSRATIDLRELAVGIPSTDPRDAIPPIYAANYESVEAAGAWLNPQDPGALVEVNGDTRFFPLAIMTRHEIVNDEIGGVPVAVTFCPLCNTALAFDRRLDGEEILLGVSGLLRNSDLVMWDHGTTSLWQQITGEAIVGEHAGKELERVPTGIVSFGEVARDRPDAQVLSRETGFGINYGTNPYRFYSSQAAPFAGFAEAPTDDAYPALERVVSVTIGDIDKAYPFSVLSEAAPINDEVGGRALVVFWGGITADALDQGSISDSRAIGTAIAFGAEVDGQQLTFEAAGDDQFRDLETGSVWTVLGHAAEGPLQGSQLELVDHRNEFWFAFRAFFPDAEVYGG